MSTNNKSRKIYEEINDVLFVSKKKSIKKRFILILLILGSVGIYSLYKYIYPSLIKIPVDDSNTFKTQEKKVEDGTFSKSSDYNFTTIQTFSKKNCDIRQSDDIYTDFFTIKGKVGRVILTSNEVTEGDLFNTRIWYTESDKDIDDLMLKEDIDFSSYIELGEGRPPEGEINYKNGIYDFSGPGRYRLRILCWNSDINIEIQDSE